MDGRTCKMCRISKPTADFNKNANRKDGLEWKCKQCKGKLAKEYRLNNIEQIIASQRKWDAVNQEKVKAARRKAVAKFRESNPKAIFAQSQVAHAVKMNYVSKLPCFECGSESVEAHHPDYDAPLDVIWLCRKHHAQLHKEHKRYTKGDPL